MNARTEILHVRLSETERERLREASEEEYLDQSAWARRAILMALDARDARRAEERRQQRERKAE